jgi:predicted lipoprotein
MGPAEDMLHRKTRPGHSAWPLLVIALVSVFAAACTVKPIGWQAAAGSGGSQNAGGVFDAKAYVASIWSSKVLPAFATKAVDAATLLGALGTDAAGAKKTYGTQSTDGGPFSFMVKGTGHVLNAGPDGLAVDLAPSDGKADVTIITGPVILGTAVRDAVGFIQFSDFVNQVDFAQVSTELNRMVKTTVFASLDTTHAVGQTVDFAGAFTLSDPAAITIVPIRLSLSGGK